VANCRPAFADHSRAAICRPAFTDFFRAAIRRPAITNIAPAIRAICAPHSAICLLRCGHLPPISLALGHLPIALQPFAAKFPRDRPFAYCAAAICRRFSSRSAICLLRCRNSPPISLALGHLPIALRPFAANFPCARPYAYCAAAIRCRFPSRSAICLLRCGNSPPISLALGDLPIALRQFAADFPRARPFAYCAMAIRRRFPSRSAICLLCCGNCR